LPFEPDLADIRIIGNYPPAAQGAGLEKARHVVYGPGVDPHAVAFAVPRNLIGQYRYIKVEKIKAAAFDKIARTAYGVPD
jgi:hypothetical protein